MYTTINHETTFKCRHYYREILWFTFTWFLWMGEECMLPVLHRWWQGQVGNYRQKWRHIPLLRQRGKGGLFFFLLFLLIFFSFHLFIFFFTTNSHTSLAKNLAALGSSRWCRACQEKTWGTCNPEGDLERVKSNRNVNCKLSTTHLIFWV